MFRPLIATSSEVRLKPLSILPMRQREGALHCCVVFSESDPTYRTGEAIGREDRDEDEVRNRPISLSGLKSPRISGDDELPSGVACNPDLGIGEEDGGRRYWASEGR
jgi:hypothetical protein